MVVSASNTLTPGCRSAVGSTLGPANRVLRFCRRNSSTRLPPHGLPASIGSPCILLTATRSPALMGESRGNDTCVPASGLQARRDLRNPGATQQAVDFLKQSRHCKAEESAALRSRRLRLRQARVCRCRTQSWPRLPESDRRTNRSPAGPHAPTSSAAVSSAPVKSSAKSRNDCMRFRSRALSSPLLLSTATFLSSDVADGKRRAQACRRRPTTGTVDPCRDAIYATGAPAVTSTADRPGPGSRAGSAVRRSGATPPVRSPSSFDLRTFRMKVFEVADPLVE